MSKKPVSSVLFNLGAKIVLVNKEVKFWFEAFALCKRIEDRNGLTLRRRPGDQWKMAKRPKHFRRHWEESFSQVNVIQYEYKQACFCFGRKIIFVQEKSESNKN